MRRLRARSALLLAALAAAAACGESDPLIPDAPECPAPCVPKIAYLRLDSVALASATTPSHDGLPLVQPGDAAIRYRVTNVGDTTSSPAPVSISHLPGYSYDTIPPLAPGQSSARSFRLDYGAVRRFPSSDVDRVSVLVHAPADSTGILRSMQSPQFRVAIPLLRIQANPDSASVRVGQPLGGQYRIVNASRYATAVGIRLVGCLVDWFAACTPNHWTTFGGWTVPPLAPQASWTFTTALLIPGVAAWQDEDLRYEAHACVVPAGHQDPYLPAEGFECSYSFELLVRPDYEGTCHPPVLRPGTAQALTAYNCGLRPPTALASEAYPPGSTNEGQFHLLAIEAAAGATYRLTRSAGTQPLRFYDADGFTQDDLDPAADRIRFAEGGRKYLVLYSPQSSVTVTLEAV